jgi:hypothetical protein
MVRGPTPLAGQAGEITMKFAKAVVGGMLLGLGLGIWIGAALVAGTDMDGMSVIPSLLLAIVGGGLISRTYRERHDA